MNGRPWYDAVYDPFWAEAERLGVPVAFHGIQMAYQEHLGQRFMDNLALAHASAHPLEMMLALGSVITAGVLERFPGLRAKFLEGSASWAALRSFACRRILHSAAVLCSCPMRGD